MRFAALLRAAASPLATILRALLEGVYTGCKHQTDAPTAGLRPHVAATGSMRIARPLLSHGAEAPRPQSSVLPSSALSRSWRTA